MDKQTLDFAKKLTGAWGDPEEELFWVFDPPNEFKYPYWRFQVKLTHFDEFDTRDFMLTRVGDIYRFTFSGAFGAMNYILSFIDEDNIQAKIRIDGEEIKQQLHRIEDIQSLFVLTKK